MGRLKPNYGRVPVRATCNVAPSVTVDGKSVPVTEVETPLLNITLPADNIFGPVGPPAGDDRSVRGARLGHAPKPADARDA